MAMNLFPKLPPIVQVTLILALAGIGSVALIIGNQDAFNLILGNTLLVHSGLIGQGFYELKQISQGKILQGSPSGIGFTPTEKIVEPPK